MLDICQFILSFDTCVSDVHLHERPKVPNNSVHVRDSRCHVGHTSQISVILMHLLLKDLICVEHRNS
jgi:hypothetical protein